MSVPPARAKLRRRSVVPEVISALWESYAGHSSRSQSYVGRGSGLVPLPSKLPSSDFQGLVPIDA